MDIFINENDYELLKNDEYTFFVLSKIMGEECEFMVSDHKKVIICRSCPPYPLWIWTADDITNDELENAYLIAKEKGFIGSNMSINMKYNAAEFFINRAAKDGISLSLKLNMFAYDCSEPIKPSEKADGCLYQCQNADTDELVHFLKMFHDTVGIDQKNCCEYITDAKELIKSEKMFFWKNAESKNVASCKYEPNGKLASINLVFTLPEYRRKHYAENLVYTVTKLTIENGYIPMLYTNADYIASNACYEKIGYVLRGKLCTIG